MGQIIVSLIVIGISGSCYPFEVLAALQILTSPRRNRNLLLLLLAYNVPIMVVAGLLVTLLSGKNIQIGSEASAIINLTIAGSALVLAILTFMGRHKHHPDKSNKPSPIAEYADNPIILGLFLVILNPSVFAFVVTGFNIIGGQPGFNVTARVFDFLIFIVSLNAVTLLSIVAYSLRPRWFRAKFNAVQRWISHHSWEIISIILVALALYTGYSGWQAIWS